MSACGGGRCVYIQCQAQTPALSQDSGLGVHVLHTRQRASPGDAKVETQFLRPRCPRYGN